MVLKQGKHPRQKHKHVEITTCYAIGVYCLVFNCLLLLFFFNIQLNSDSTQISIIVFS